MPAIAARQQEQQQQHDARSGNIRARDAAKSLRVYALLKECRHAHVQGCHLAPSELVWHKARTEQQQH